MFLQNNIEKVIHFTDTIILTFCVLNKISKYGIIALIDKYLKIYRNNRRY